MRFSLQTLFFVSQTYTFTSTRYIGNYLRFTTFAEEGANQMFAQKKKIRKKKEIKFHNKST